MTDKRTIETVLYDQRDELQAKKTLRLCHRREEAMIDLDSPQAQVVIGVRRSGKSTMCYNAMEAAAVNYAYVNFDDERFARISGDQLNDVLEVLYKIYGDFTHLFIDEIQNIDAWYLFVNRLLRRNMRVVITGSNAKLLSGELATHLTGRNSKIELFPFSFAEYCDFKGIDTGGHTTKAEAFLRAAFDDYMTCGGFPELLSIKNKRGYVNELVDNILKRDIEKRYRIQHAATFEQLAQHLLNTAPAILSGNNIRDAFSLKSVHTVNNYTNFLRQAYLLVGLHKYSTKSRLRIVGEKVYPVDVALMNGRIDAMAGKNLGWRMETIVYLELLRRHRPEGRDIYYFAERSGECDFIVCQGNMAVMAIQVSYDLTDPKTKKRELAGLLLAARRTRCTRLLLLTDHEREDLNVNGFQIAVRPVYEWAVSYK